MRPEYFMIIRLNESHLPAASELFRDVFSCPPWNDDWSDPGTLRAYLTDITGNPNSLSFGYLHEGKLSAISLGQVFNWWRGREYNVREFCVARHLQRKGIGTLFITAIENLLRDEGISSMSLLTARKTPAFDFYITNGFHESDEMSFLVKNIK